jgi:hypothetical protein
MTIAGDEIVSGIPDRFEYRVFSRAGVLQRTVRATVPTAPVTASDARGARAMFIARGASLCRERLACSAVEAARANRAFANVADSLSLPKTWPAYADLRGDDDGSVWVLRYSVNPDDAQWWARFDRSGVLQGTLHIPANLAVLRFTRGHVLLKQIEPVDGFSFVAAHRIQPVK